MPGPESARKTPSDAERMKKEAEHLIREADRLKDEAAAKIQARIRGQKERTAAEVQKLSMAGRRTQSVAERDMQFAMRQGSALERLTDVESMTAAWPHVKGGAFCGAHDRTPHRALAGTTVI